MFFDQVPLIGSYSSSRKIACVSGSADVLAPLMQSGKVEELHAGTDSATFWFRPMSMIFNFVASTDYKATNSIILTFIFIFYNIYLI